jgi:biopolymer transport protein ExbD
VRLEKNSILIAVTAENKVFHGGQEVGVGGVQNVVRPMLLEDEELPVIIQADTNAFRGVLAGVKRTKLTAATQ